ncbi:MAG: hypothetical protein LBG45_03165 [Dysgonamonadaceae bacterium]|jgi:hypothetical protein|nr:hypothetical protein [Dysgonamonadaceae bacterium]
MTNFKNSSVKFLVLHRVGNQKEYELELADDFTISDSAVKKQTRIFKSVIKLDKNFHIYVHGNSDLIQQGTDENGKFYKIYYKEEN